MGVRYEPAFALLNYLVKAAVNSYSVLLLLIAALVIALKWVTIVRYASFPLVSLLANASFCALDLFTVRQGIAVALCVFSVAFVINRQPVRFLMLVLLAVCFHYTAIVFALAYVIFFWDLSFKRLASLSVLFFCFSTFVSVSGVIVYVADHLSPGLYWLASVYADSKMELNSGLSEGGLHGLRFMKGGVTLLVYGYFLSRQTVTVVQRGFFNLYSFYFLVTTLLAGENHVFMRFSMYFSIFEIFLVSEVFVGLRSMMRLVLFLLILAYLCLKLVYGFYDTWDLFFPFETIFDASFKETY